MKAKVKVLTEGAEIYCERRSNGPLLLPIHGAMEDAGFYSSTADILAETLTKITPCKPYTAQNLQ